jgi:hypothetical protein
MRCASGGYTGLSTAAPKPAFSSFSHAISMYLGLSSIPTKFRWGARDDGIDRPGLERRENLATVAADEERLCHAATIRRSA